MDMRWIIWRKVDSCYKPLGEGDDGYALDNLAQSRQLLQTSFCPPAGSSASAV